MWKGACKIDKPERLKPSQIYTEDVEDDKKTYQEYFPFFSSEAIHVICFIS